MMFMPFIPAGIHATFAGIAIGPGYTQFKVSYV